MTKHPLLVLILGCAIGSAITATALHLVRPARPEAHATASVSGEVAAARLKEILAGDDPLHRVSEIASLLPAVDPTAAATVAGVFETAALDSGDPELILYGMWWAQHDPQAAYNWTTTDWRARHANVIAAVVRIWAHTDPKAALSAAQGVPFAHQRDLATDAAVVGWDESEQPGLLETLAHFNMIQSQQLSESIARRRVIGLGPERALQWADSLPEGTLRDTMSVRVASAAAAGKTGARIAAEWARPRVREGKGVVSNYPRRIATRWVQHDPEATWTWLASLPAGDDRDDGVAEAYRTWLRRDPVAAHRWIEKTGILPWNEPAVGIYARALSWERPKDAIELSRRLTDESWREDTTAGVAQNWYQMDPEAAKAWLAQADLPERTREAAKMVRDSNPANKEQMERLIRGNRPPGAGAEWGDQPE